MNDDELDPELENEEEQEEQEQDNQEQKGPNPEKAKDEVKQKIDKAKKMKEKIEKAKKAKKTAETAKKVKAAAKFASGAKKFALLANPYFWIALLIIIAILMLIGIIMSFTIMPSNFLGKCKQVVEGMMKGFCGIVWGDNTSSISNNSDEVKNLANYIQDMGYDIQGYGFGDVEYTKEAEEEREKAEESANKTEVVSEDKRNYVTQSQATHGGEIKKVFGLQAVTTVSSSEYNDGDEMYRITGRFSSKNNDYLRAYLSADAATYTEATYSIKGWFNELGSTILSGLKDIFGGHTSSDWKDPGDVGVESKSTGMLNITNAGGNNLFNSDLSGSPTRIKVDAKNKKLILYEKALSLGIFKIQWGQTFSVDLSNWTAIYGRPLELFLALHLSSMMPDLPYQMAVDQAFNTKANIGLQDATINFDTHMKIEGHQVTFGEDDVVSETGQETKEENLDALVDKFLLEQLGATNKNSFWNKIRDHLYDQNFAQSVGGEENAKKYRRCVVEAFQDQLNVDDTTTGWLGNKDAINYRAAMAQADKYFREQSYDANAARQNIAQFLKDAIIDNIKNLADDVWAIITDIGGFIDTVLADIVNLFGSFFGWLDDLVPEIRIDMGTGFLAKLANWILPEYDPENPHILSYDADGEDPITEEQTIEGEDGNTTTETVYTEEAKNGGGQLVIDLFGTASKACKDLADSMMDLFYVKIETGSDTSGIQLKDDQGNSFTANLTNDDYQNLTKLVAAGLGGTSIKWPYLESVTNHWYYHIIDFIGTVGKDTLYGAYKKAATAKKTIKYSDEEGGLNGYEIELTALLSSDEGIFYQVCEPYLNEKPSLYLKKIFHGAYYKYDGTTDTARKIAAARAIEAEFKTDDYTDTNKFPKSVEEILSKEIKYNWHSSDSDNSKLTITREDATDYISAKKAQVKIQEKSQKLIDQDEEEAKGNKEKPEVELREILEEVDEDNGELAFDSMGEESPMCKKLVDFKSDKSNTLEAFSILENVNSEAADVNYRLLKKLMVEMDYFTEDEMNSHEKNILLWITNVEGTKGADVAATINRNLGQTDNAENKTISDTSRDTNEYGVIISNFMEDTQIIAPGDAKVKSKGSDEHGEYVELEFTTLTDDKVYPLQGTMMLLHQDDEQDPFYNYETPYDREPLYSAAEVMRRYRFRETFQVFEDDDVVGITMKISGLHNIKVAAGDTVLRGQEIAAEPKNGTGDEDSGDKIYVSMKKADKTKIENVEDYIDPVYTYEDEKDMAEQLWYLDHPEYGNRYNSNGNLNIDYVEWAQQQAENSEVGYCQTHRKYNENANGCLDVDCSSFVYYALLNNNYDVRKYSSGPFGTSSEPETLKSLGFIEMDFPGVSGCQKGDILWRDGHTEIYSGDGKSVGAHGPDNTPPPTGHRSHENREDGTTRYAVDGDQTGGEVSEVNCSTNWTRIYRPPLSVGTPVGLSNAAGYQPNWNNNAAWQSPSNPLAAGFMGQCTYFAWGCSYELYGFACWDGCGNGIDVARSVVRCNPDKFKLSSTPVPGAIFSTPSGSVYGHTGVVLEVNSDGSCVIFDGNYNGHNDSFAAAKQDCGTRTYRFPAGAYFACPIEPR